MVEELGSPLAYTELDFFFPALKSQPPNSLGVMRFGWIELLLGDSSPCGSQFYYAIFLFSGFE